MTVLSGPLNPCHCLSTLQAGETKEQTKGWAAEKLEQAGDMGSEMIDAVRGH